MRVLILSCNTGEGHNSTASAISEVMEQRGIQAVTMDALSLWSPEMSKFICNWHVRIYRKMPKLFDVGYKLLDNQPQEPGKDGMVYEMLSKGADALYQLITEKQYDAVICVHMFAGMMLTEVKRQFHLAAPTFFVATDYTCSPYVDQCQMDTVFIPDERLIGEFLAKNLPASRLYPSGIPVKQTFFTKEDKMVVRRRLGLPQNKKILLCMSGSMGAGHIKKLVKTVVENLPENAMMVFICGSNEKLYNDFLKYSGNKLHLLGFTKEMSAYMDAADLMLSKPGGLSSTEAAAKGLPLIFVNAVGGCEGPNLEYFCKHRFALTAEDADELVYLTCKTLMDDKALLEMSRRLKEGFLHNGAVEICNIVTQKVLQRSMHAVTL